MQKNNTKTTLNKLLGVLIDFDKYVKMAEGGIPHPATHNNRHMLFFYSRNFSLIHSTDSSSAKTGWSFFKS